MSFWNNKLNQLEKELNRSEVFCKTFKKLDKKEKTVLDSIDGQRWEQYFMNLYQEEPGNINLILPKKTNECQR